MTPAQAKELEPQYMRMRSREFRPFHSIDGVLALYELEEAKMRAILALKKARRATHLRPYQKRAPYMVRRLSCFLHRLFICHII